MQNRAMHWPNAPLQGDSGSDQNVGPKTGYETEVPPRPRPDDKDPKKQPAEGGKSGS